MHGRGRRLGVRLRHRMAQNEVLRLYLAATRANGTKRRSTVFARAGIGVQACCARATDGGASPTLAAWGRNQAARSRLMVQCWDLGGPGNGPHLLLCSLAASRSARCSKDATPLSRATPHSVPFCAAASRPGSARAHASSGNSGSDVLIAVDIGGGLGPRRDGRPIPLTGSRPLTKTIGIVAVAVFAAGAAAGPPAKITATAPCIRSAARAGRRSY